MRAYVMTTGVLFGVLALVHAWRAVAEGGGLGKDPWFVIITIAAVGLCVWAWQVLQRMPR